MCKNPISIVVGLTLLPITAIALQDSMELIKLPNIQAAPLNTPIAAAVTKHNPIHIVAAPGLQLAQSDTPPTGSGEQAEQNYLKSIAKEAVRSNVDKDALPVPEQTSMPDPSSQNTQSTPAQDQKKLRVDHIKSIVSGTGDNSKPEQPLRQLSQPTEKSQKASSLQQRRQQLREVVVDAPAAKDKVNKGYVSILKDEVSTTVVIDEESARRPAVTATTAHPGSPGSLDPVLLESEGVYLYRVQYGDSLWLIAKRFYRDGHRYIDLYQANRDVLDHEDMLIVGQVLRVPKAGANN